MFFIVKNPRKKKCYHRYYVTGRKNKYSYLENQYASHIGEYDIYGLVTKHNSIISHDEMDPK